MIYCIVDLSEYKIIHLKETKNVINRVSDIVFAQDKQSQLKCA